MDRSERYLVPDRRLQELAHFGRTANHQFAERKRIARPQPCMEDVLDTAHAIAFQDGELNRVIARREAGAGLVLERRGNAVHHRQQAGVEGAFLDDLPGLVGDDIGESGDT